MSWAGATVMFVTLIAPAFPTLGHQPAGFAWTIPPALGAIVFGVFAAILGHHLGQHVERPARTSQLAPIKQLGVAQSSVSAFVEVFVVGAQQAPVGEPADDVLAAGIQDW